MSLQRVITSASPVSTLGALAAPLVYFYQVHSMERWRREMGRDPEFGGGAAQDDEHPPVSAKEFIQKTLRVARLGMGRREVVGFIGFCLLFIVRSWATMRRVSANSRVLEAFAFGAKRRAAVLEYFYASLLLAAVDSTITNVRFWLIASLRQTLSSSCHKLLMERDRFARANYEPECDAAQSIPCYCAEFAEHVAELPLYFLQPTADAITAMFFFWRSAGNNAGVITAVTFGSMGLIRAVQPDIARMHASQVVSENSFSRRHYTVQEQSEAISMASGSAYFYEVLNRYLHQVYATSCRYAAGVANNFMLFRTMDLAVWDVVPLLLWLHDGSLQGEAAVRSLVLQREAARRFNKSVSTFWKNWRTELTHAMTYSVKMCTFLAALSDVDVISNCHDPAVEPPRVHFATPAIVAEVSDVDIRTPTNVELLCNFSLRIEESSVMMIVGPNGTGKTSLLRVLTGLWPVSAGRVRVAKDTKVLCLPQQSFHLRKAQLRDQLWFPARPPPNTLLPEEFDLAAKAMKMACLDALVDLIGGWSSPFSGYASAADHQHVATISAVSSTTSTSPATVPPRVAPAASTNTASLSGDGYPWHSLSGGQKQKLAMARLLFTIMMDKKILERPFRFRSSSSDQNLHARSSQQQQNPQQHHHQHQHQHHHQQDAAQQLQQQDSLSLRGSVLPSTPLTYAADNNIRDALPPSAFAGAMAAAAGSTQGVAATATATAASFSVEEKNKRRRRYLVLLDESTSQVDGDAEEKIIRGLKSLSLVTIMCISHRKQMAQHADKILVLTDDKALPPVVVSVTEYLNTKTEHASPSLKELQAVLE